MNKDLNALLDYLDHLCICGNDVVNVDLISFVFYYKIRFTYGTTRERSH